MDQQSFADVVLKQWQAYRNTRYTQDGQIKQDLVQQINQSKWQEQVEKNGYYISQKDRWFKESKIAVHFHSNLPISIAPHCHDFFEMIYVYQGQVTNFIDGNEIGMEQGDICLLNANALHQMSTVDLDTIVIDILMEKSLFENAFFCVLNGNEAVFNFFADSLYRKNQEQNYMLFPFVDYQQTDTLEALRKIIMESFLKRTSYQKAIEIAAISLFLGLTKSYYFHQEKESIRELHGPDISQIVGYIGKHYQEVTIESTANHFNYNPNYLSRLLKKYVGSTFSDIVQRFRLNAAKDYLEHTTMSIDEIVSLVGYANKSYFYRIFREETGMSPAEFRKK